MSADHIDKGLYEIQWCEKTTNRRDNAEHDNVTDVVARLWRCRRRGRGRR